MTPQRSTYLPAPAVFERDTNARGETIWVYAGTHIPVPGARDVTLAERVRPRELRRPGEQPEAIIVSLDEIKRDHALNWVIQRGEHFTSERGIQLFSVPWHIWQEHASRAVDVFAPEQGEASAERQLAIAERELRFARAGLEQATLRRLKMVAICTELGMTRRELATLAGVSTGRVQQLFEEVPEEMRETVRATLRDAETLFAELPSDPHDRDAIPVPRGWTRAKLIAVLDELVDCGLLAQDDEARSVWPTRSLSTLGEAAQR